MTIQLRLKQYLRVHFSTAQTLEELLYWSNQLYECKESKVCEYIFFSDQANPHRHNTLTFYE